MNNRKELIERWKTIASAVFKAEDEIKAEWFPRLKQAKKENAAEILTQWMGRGNELISQRTYDVTQKADCPYRKEHYPKRNKKKDKNQLELELEL